MDKRLKHMHEKYGSAVGERCGECHWFDDTAPRGGTCLMGTREAGGGAASADYAACGLYVNINE